ncbi:MAG: hypothetical protein AAGF60_11205 [Pseudomonadota bacterium]
MNDLPAAPQFKTTRKANPPETPIQDQPETTTTTSGADDGSHLEDLRVPDIEGEAVDPDAPFRVDEDGNPDLPPAAPEQIDREAFWIVFQTAFNLPGQMAAHFKPVGIQDDEKAGARAASDAVYALLEIYYPAALMPQSETLAHLLVAGPFLIGKAMIVRNIIASERARPVREAPRPQSASTTPPADAGGDVVAMNNWVKPGQGGFA